ncbi:MAG: hypothetical protein Q7S22_01150 [Candidatus Micrarchaeota archaeon]|nr:hypothetical protein [Candidatus Micrarchaeota archaeon]
MYSKRIQRLINKAERFYLAKGPDASNYFKRAKQVFDVAVEANIITEHRLQKELNPFRRFFRFIRGTRIGMENMVVADLILYAHVSASTLLPSSVRRRVGQEFDNLAALKELDVSELPADSERQEALLREYAFRLNNGFPEAAYTINGQYLSPSLAVLARAAYISTYSKRISLIFESVDGLRTIPNVGTLELLNQQKRTASKAWIYTAILECGGFHPAVNAIKDWIASIRYPAIVALFVSQMALTAPQLENSKGIMLVALDKLQRGIETEDLILVVRNRKSTGSAVFKIVDRFRDLLSSSICPDLSEARMEKLGNLESSVDANIVLSKILSMRDSVASKVIFDLKGMPCFDYGTRVRADKLTRKTVDMLIETISQKLGILPEDIEVTQDLLDSNGGDTGKFKIEKESSTKKVTITTTNYYARPKPNLYRSQHISVVFNSSELKLGYLSFEIIIRDDKTDHICDHGGAAHYQYKLAREGVLNSEISQAMRGFSDFIVRLSGPENIFGNHSSRLNPNNSTNDYGLLNWLRKTTRSITSSILR